jgi:hypothetical protein
MPSNRIASVKRLTFQLLNDTEALVIGSYPFKSLKNRDQTLPAQNLSGICHSIAVLSRLHMETIMAANALVQTRIDAEVRDRASAVLESMGLTVSDALRIMLTRTANEGRCLLNFFLAAKRMTPGFGPRCSKH